jgi:Flp pilus assembly protein TadB
MLALLLSTFFALGVALSILAMAEVPLKDPFATYLRGEDSLPERFRNELRRAGIFDEAPSLVLLALATASLALGSVLALIAGSAFMLAVGPILVAVGAYAFLERRRRTMTVQTADALVPLMRRIEAAVRAGTTVQAAYRLAVSEASPPLKAALADSLVAISAGKPFLEALQETKERVPFRMWELFVSQIEIHDQVGGNLARGISASVKHIDDMLSLQRQGRAEYASFASQRRIAFLFGGAAILFFATKLQPELVREMWTSPIGWVFIGVALVLILIGLFVQSRTLRSIDERIHF